MSINNPVAALSRGYLAGLKLSNDATTPDSILGVSAGFGRDSTGLYTLGLGNASTVDNTVSGIGGIDTGSVAASTFYSVYIIGDSSGKNGVGLIMSTVHTGAITFPSGYDIFLRLGSVLTDGTSDNLKFTQRGNGNDRTIWYGTSIATDITAGGSASYAAVDVSASIPVASLTAILRYSFIPTAGNDELNIRNGDSAVAGDAEAVASGSVAAVATLGMLTCPVGATLASGLDYKVTGTAVALNVNGYIDEL